jgi:hypothetical protein
MATVTNALLSKILESAHALEVVAFRETARQCHYEKQTLNAHVQNPGNLQSNATDDQGCEKSSISSDFVSNLSQVLPSWLLLTEELPWPSLIWLSIMSTQKPQMTKYCVLGFEPMASWPDALSQFPS